MIRSINPYSGEKVFETKQFTKKQINAAISKADSRFQSWRHVPFTEKSKFMLAAASELRKNVREYAETITKEMGKPITQSIAEVEKCATVCEYYAKNAAEHLSNKTIKTEAQESYVSYEPIGIVLAIMPWNYPFWQVFRFAAPALMAGNVGILKHASNVMKCGENLEKIFKRAGFPEGCFTNLPIKSDMIKDIIKDEKVKAVTLTGSTKAGSEVAAEAGAQIKKTVLELGGSNALVVFPDCNLDETVKVCIAARFQNTGQSCIAGKRLLLHNTIAKKFTEKFVAAIKEIKTGDPMNPDTYLATMAREDLAEELEKQLQNSLKEGAQIIIGGKRNKAFFEPTLVTGVSSENTLFKEETFGPVIGITTFENDQEAVDLVNVSKFGLGVSIFTENFEKAKKLIPQFDDGAVFVNELVKSDPRLPFGGTKNSGYGRELSVDGIQEFVNKKTVYIHKF